MSHIKFDLTTCMQVCKVITCAEKYLSENDRVFMMIDVHGQKNSFRSPISGVVTKLYIKEGDILSYGSSILEYEQCTHPLVFKQLCAVCGVFLQEAHSQRNVIATKLSCLTIRNDQKVAAKYTYDKCQLLLRQKKLHLLIDLDETLVHTSNPLCQFTPSTDVFSFELDQPIRQTVFTKLRPGVREFLINLQPLFQFHVVTFGDRPYANAIVQLIDPHGKFFSERILSRDESVSLTDKAANLTSLFPQGDSLVCIIDDREDVWRHARNVIRVKPYTWFGDASNTNNVHLPSIPTSNDFIVSDDDHYLQRLETILKSIHSMFYQIHDRQCLESIPGVVPDLKQIMPVLRRQILHSVSLCFSHLLPENYPFEQYRGTHIAQAMGAVVTRDLQLDHQLVNRTTHVVAGKPTWKVHQALQHNIKVVTLDWLLDCYEQWQRQPEENYPLTVDYQVEKCRLFTEITPRVPKRRCDDMQQEPAATDQPRNLNMDIDERLDAKDGHCQENNDIDERLSKRQRTASITKDAEQEIDELFFNSTMSDSDGYDSDDEYLSDDEVPRGWKETIKQRRICAKK